MHVMTCLGTFTIIIAIIIYYSMLCYYYSIIAIQTFKKITFCITNPRMDRTQPCKPGVKINHTIFCLAFSVNYISCTVQ